MNINIRKYISFSLWFLVFLCLNITSLPAEDKKDESSIFFSGDLGPARDISTLMVDSSKSRGLSGPLTHSKGFVVLAETDAFSDSDKVILEKVIGKIEYEYKVLLYDEKTDTIIGDLKVQFIVTKSGEISNYKVLQSTLNNKKVVSFTQKKLESLQFGSAGKAKKETLSLSFYPGVRK